MGDLELVRKRPLAFGFVLGSAVVLVREGSPLLLAQTALLVIVAAALGLLVRNARADLQAVMADD